MESFRESIVIFDWGPLPDKSKGYGVGCCRITPWGGNGKERIYGSDTSCFRIVPELYNPTDDGEHLVALVKDGYSHPGVSYAPIVAHNETELQDKMYARATEIAKAESKWYKKPIEDRTSRSKDPGLEMVVEWSQTVHF